MGLRGPLSPDSDFVLLDVVALVWYLEHRCPAYSGRPCDSLPGCLSSNKLSVSNVFIACFSLSRVFFPPSDGVCHRGKGLFMEEKGNRTGGPGEGGSSSRFMPWEDAVRGAEAEAWAP